MDEQPATEGGVESERRDRVTGMMVLRALMITLVALGVMLLCGAYIHFTLGWAVVLGTSAWAGYDAHKLEMERYGLGGPNTPMGTVLGCLLLWIVVFPWYLVNRQRVLAMR